MLKLPSVTLVALTGIGYKTQEHIEAIKKSCEGIEFGEVKLIQLGSIVDIDSWNRAIVFDLGDYIQTSHCLLVHDNGFVVNSESWNPKWLEYDFCGSPFPEPKDEFSYRDINGTIQRVGNSVGLRSKKLLDLPKKLGMEWKSFHGFWSEDGYITVNMRHIFEQNGCKFMPFNEAIYFGRENEIKENTNVDKPFIFHNYIGKNAIYA